MFKFAGEYNLRMKDKGTDGLCCNWGQVGRLICNIILCSVVMTCLNVSISLYYQYVMIYHAVSLHNVRVHTQSCLMGIMLLLQMIQTL